MQWNYKVIVLIVKKLHDDCANFKDCADFNELQRNYVDINDKLRLEYQPLPTVITQIK